MAKEITLALAQFAMSAEPQENLKKAVGYIEKAAKAGADIVCLPELFMSPYFCVVEKAPRDYAEPLEGETSKTLAQAAQKNKIAVIGGSIYENAGDKKYNTALVYNNKGDLLGHYRKTHIPHDPGFYEMNYFEPGDTGFKVFDLGCAKVSVLICYDQWFPEAARASALLGAEIIFYPTAIGNMNNHPNIEGNWQEAWENAQRGHAITNNLIVAAVNRVGVEGDSVFWGGSFVCNAFGKTLVRGGVSNELIIQKVDLDHSKYAKESWRFFASRRPNCYQGLTKN